MSIPLRSYDHAGIRSERARRPAYLVSNLINCAACGGGFSEISKDLCGCSNARNRGTCGNRLAIRRDVLEANAEERTSSGTRLHSGLAEVCQQKVENLVAESSPLVLRDEASEVVRGLISKILLIPENGRLEVELCSDLAGILALASGSKKPVSQRDGLQQVTLVAGERNNLNLLFSAAA